jgi:hypothetical protein
MILTKSKTKVENNKANWRLIESSLCKERERERWGR